ncbi:MAG: hypothetical protein NVS4B8_17400 [Herpetosiphon sp.]
MQQTSPSYYQLIEDCEAAIIRIRAALRQGEGHTDEVSRDWNKIVSAITPRLVKQARHLRAVAPLAEEEVFEAMLDRLTDDILSLTYVSLETKFGAYMRTMPILVLRRVRAKHIAPGTSSPVERLDQPVGEDGMLHHESIGDPSAQHPFDAIGEQEALSEAIALLPAPERQVLRLRLAGTDNNAIARQLGVAPATATRIYQRSIAELKRRLDPGTE